MTSKPTYQKSHPWITFRLRLDRLPPDFWILAGEAKSKCEHIASVPLKPDVGKQLHEVYLVKGLRATVAIEGNTLSEDEVQKRIEGELKLPQSQEYLGTEIDNVLEAINHVDREVKNRKPPAITVEVIKEFNRIILKNLDLQPGVTPGEIRKEPFGVGGYRGVPAAECEFLLARLCEWLNSPDFQPPNWGKERTIIPSMIKAILAHLYLEWIHPFGDGNGRTGRLVEFVILVCSGVPTSAAHLLSNHYNLTRTEYYRQLDASSKSGGDVVPFLIYAVQGLVDGLRSQLEFIRAHQWDLAWHSYVYEQFRDKVSKSDVRRRRLVHDLSNMKDPVPLNQLPQISTRVAAAYATRGARTLSRDLNVLKEMDLIEGTPEGYRAKNETILVFLPFCRDPVENDEEKTDASDPR